MVGDLLMNKFSILSRLKIDENFNGITKQNGLDDCFWLDFHDSYGPFAEWTMPYFMGGSISNEIKTVLYILVLNNNIYHYSMMISF